MTSRCTSWTDPAARSTWGFALLLAVLLTAFCWGVGLRGDRLPFPPGSDYSDAVTSHWPNALFLKRAILEEHAFPLWRPLIMSGQPFAANPLNKVWYPPQWLVLLLPPIPHLNLLAGLHLFAAGLGAWTFARAAGLHPWPAALAGLGYTFAPRLIAALGAGHLDLIYAAAWFPWLLWAVRRAASGAGPWLPGIFAALCVLADVRLSAYFFVTAAGYALVLARRPRADAASGTLQRTAALWIAAALLAAGLSAVQWVPLLLLRARLSRGVLTLADAAAFRLDWGQWAGLLFGDHGGPPESMIYAGISTLALALIALLRRPRALGGWGLAVLAALLYALGDHFVLWSALNRLLPPLRWWRIPPRAWFVAALILPYLAGWGAQVLVEPWAAPRRARRAAVGLLGGGLACSLFSLLALTPPLDRGTALGLLALPALALVVLLALTGRLRAPRAPLLCALIVAADVLWIDGSLVEGRARRAWLDPSRAVAEALIERGATRVYSPSYSLPQQAAAYWNIPLFGGVDPFQLAAYVRAAEAATGVRARGYSVTIPAFATAQEAEFATVNRGAPLDAAALGRWLVDTVISEFPIQAAGLELDTRIGSTYLYRNTLAPRVMLDWDGPNRVTIHAAEELPAGELYAVANSGRWQDQPSAPPGLPGAVSPGAQAWTLTYDPSEVWIGLGVGAALIGLAAGVWRLGRG